MYFPIIAGLQQGHEILCEVTFSSISACSSVKVRKTCMSDSSRPYRMELVLLVLWFI